MAVLKDKPKWRGTRAAPESRERPIGDRRASQPSPDPTLTRAAPRSSHPGRRLITKARGKEWKTNYRLRVEIGLSTSLLFLLLLFRSPLYESDSAFDIELSQQEVVEMEEILQTKQPEKAPPPPRPPVPVEVADETVIDDEELDLDVTLDINEAPAYVPPPPEPVEEEEPEEDLAEIFVVVEEMPEIIGGPNKIYEYLEYPPIARQAQMEGLVVVQVIVEPDGSASEPTIVRSAGLVLDDAAIEAVKKLRFKPGKQRGRPVRVKLAIPIRFKLKDRS